jgi:hypothetical protein
MMTGKPPFGGATLEDIIWGHLEKPFPIEVAREANIPTGWIHLIKKMMERSPDDRFADYRELRTALENVNSFRHETAPIEPAPAPKPISVPRTGNNSQTLHGLLVQSKAQWITSEHETGSSLHLSQVQVIEALKDRMEPLQVQMLLSSIRDLCQPREEEPAALAEVMDKVPGYENAVRALANFMVNPDGEEEAEAMTAVEALETLGLERARNLAITFFALNYEKPVSTTFDWTPLWRHQLSVAVIMDFLYDALDLKRTGLEYAAGAFHDIGKMILSEVFPFAYFATMNRSIQEHLSLVDCERDMFEMDHAEIGSGWMKDNELPHALVEAIAQHERPVQVSRRSLLTHALICANHLVKQIGIGYSGNSTLDPRAWEDLPSTRIIWESRGNKEYAFEDFTHDILGQFQSFPDLI